MAEFTPALAFVLDSEDPKRQYAVVKDNNGADCISGINAQFYPREVAEIAALPQEARGPAVATFYYRRYWAPVMTRIASQRIASKLLDMCVNMEPVISDRGVAHGEAITLCQRAINRDYTPALAVDGVLGGVTVAALNQSAEYTVLEHLALECERFYREVVSNKPEYANQLKGWLNRAYRFPAIKAAV